MQLIIEEWVPSQKMFVAFGIVILFVLLSLIGIAINAQINKKNGKKYEFSEIFQSLLISIVLAISLFVSIKLVYKDVLYAVDYKNDSIVETVEIIVEVEYNRDYCKIWTEEGNVYSVGNFNYGIKEHKIINDKIQEDFIGHKCKIEYFQLSKYIHSIVDIN